MFVTASTLACTCRHVGMVEQVSIDFTKCITRVRKLVNGTYRLLARASERIRVLSRTLVTNFHAILPRAHTRTYVFILVHTRIQR